MWACFDSMRAGWCPGGKGILGRCLWLGKVLYVAKRCRRCLGIRVEVARTREVVRNLSVPSPSSPKDPPGR